MKLPNGWRTVALRQVAEVRTGLALGRVSLRDPVRLPYLRVANVQDGHLDLTEVKTIEVNRDEVPRYSLRAGDVLLTEGGDFDKLGRGTVWQGEIPGCLHQNHVFCVRADGSELDPYYFSSLTSSPYGRSYFLGCSKKSTNLASINSSQLKEMPLPLPPLDEQIAIGKRLLCWDRAIKQLNQLIAAKFCFRRGLEQQLLTGIKWLKTVDSRAIREDRDSAAWVEVKAGDLFANQTVKKNDGEELLSVTQDKGVIPRRMLDGKVVMPEGSTSGYKLVEPGNFVISLRSFQGGLEYSNYRGLVSPAYTVLRPSKPIHDEFYQHYFKSFEFIQRLGVAVIGIRDGKQISFTDFQQVRLPCPPISEQKRIARLLNVCNQEITLLGKQLSAIIKQKKGLMQKLLTGEVRARA